DFWILKHTHPIDVFDRINRINRMSPGTGQIPSCESCSSCPTVLTPFVGTPGDFLGNSSILTRRQAAVGGSYFWILKHTHPIDVFDRINRINRMSPGTGQIPSCESCSSCPTVLTPFVGTPGDFLGNSSILTRCQAAVGRL